MINEKITLYNGVKVPVLGLGTWMIDDDKVKEVVINAFKLGYRHIDTAEVYGNERGVGEAIRESGLKREEIFLTTKLIAEAKTYEEAKEQIELSFKKLGVDYIDLMIIHSPQPWADFRNVNHYYEGNLAAWKALCEFYEAGKIRAIGVSNFEKEDIENILKHSKVKPMVNQILTHISNTQISVIKYCQENGIAVEAYSPLAHGEILKNKTIKEIADRLNVSIAQLSIRYTLELGLISLPKATSVEHLKDNLDVNFKISSGDMKKLIELDNIENYGDYSFFPVFSGKLKE